MINRIDGFESAYKTPSRLRSRVLGWRPRLYLLAVSLIYQRAPRASAEKDPPSARW